MERRTKKAVVAVAAGAVGLLVAALLFLLSRTDSDSGTPEPAGMSEEGPVATRPVPPVPAVPLRPAVPARPPTQRSEHPGAAGEAVEEEPPYEVRVLGVRTSHRAADGPDVVAWLDCEIDFGRKVPERTAVVDSGKVLRGQTKKGAPVIHKRSHGFVRALRSGRQRHRFTVGAVVPADTGRLSFIEGTFTKVVAVETGRVVWDDPARQKGERRSAGGFEFVLAGYDRTASEVKAEFHFRVPEPRPGEPRYWGSGSTAYRVCCEDGSLLEMRGGGGGTGLGGRWGQWECGAKVGNRNVKALEASFVTRIKLEELPFSLEDVELPSAPRLAANRKEAPVGPRGSTSVTSAGYVFRLDKVELTRRRRGNRRTGELRLRIKIRLPDGHDDVAVPVVVLDAEAVDDKGTKLTTGRDPEAMRGLSRRRHEESLQAEFPLPHDEANRLVTFSGKYRVFCAEETSCARFELANMPEELNAPVRRGPVSLTGVSRVNDIVKLTMRIDKSAFPTESYFWISGTKFDLLDGNGEPMRMETAGGDSGGRGSRTHRYFISFDTRGRVPATFVVSYPTGCSIRDIPFEFENVGLPRRPGRYSYEEDVF